MATKTCPVCQTTQNISARSSVCTPCRQRLFAKGLVWCSVCRAIGDSISKQRTRGRCRACHRTLVIEQERAYVARRKEQGWKRQSSPTHVMKTQTPEECDAISQLLDKGLSIRQVEQRLGISRARVRSTIRRGAAISAGSARHTGTMTPVLTSVQLSLIFRGAATRLATWRRSGLNMKPYGKDTTCSDLPPMNTRIYYISERALERWMLDRTSWMLWDLNDVIDPFWHAYAQSFRATTSGRWMTVKEVAPFLGLQPGSVKRRIREGDYQGAWRKVLHQFWLWSEDVVDHALRYDGRMITIPEAPCGHHGTKRG
jgi:hypothetical protein